MKIPEPEIEFFSWDSVAAYNFQGRPSIVIKVHGVAYTYVVRYNTKTHSIKEYSRIANE